MVDDELRVMLLTETVRTSYMMYKLGTTVEQIALERKLASCTVMAHLSTCLERGLNINVEKLGVTKEILTVVARVVWEPPISSDVSGLGPVKYELVKKERGDIDWGKLRLAVGRLKVEYGVTEEGILRWTSKDYLSYMGVEHKSADEGYGDDMGPSKLVSTHDQPDRHTMMEDMPVWFPAVKRKEQEDSMTAEARTEMGKKRKANSLFKWK